MVQTIRRPGSPRRREPPPPPTYSYAEADELLARAHAAWYRWPVGFAGFDAVARLGRVDTRVAVRPPEHVDVTARRRDDELAHLRWVLRSVIELVAPADDPDDGRLKLVRHDPDDRSILHVDVLDDPQSTSYLVRDGEISGISRGRGSFRIATVVMGRHMLWDGRSVPTRLCTTVRAADPVRTETVELVGLEWREDYPYVLPQQRWGLHFRRRPFLLRDIELRGHVLAQPDDDGASPLTGTDSPAASAANMVASSSSGTSPTTRATTLPAPSTNTIIGKSARP